MEGKEAVKGETVGGLLQNDQNPSKTSRNSLPMSNLAAWKGSREGGDGGLLQNDQTLPKPTGIHCR